MGLHWNWNQFLPLNKVNAQVRIEALGIYKNAPASINFYELGTLTEKYHYTKMGLKI